MNIREATIGLLERRLVKAATVLAVRVWEPATLVEVDLHMPGCDMHKWQEAQHMKCRVAPMVYRDYTPTEWDAETQTCSLFIDTGHDGPGSRWARGLVAGDRVEYLGVGSSHQQPVDNKRLVFLGDESAIGHILALQQLAGTGMQKEVQGAVTMKESRHRDEFNRYFRRMGLCAVERTGKGDFGKLEEWVDRLEGVEPGNTRFYLAGNVPGVVKLRKMLRTKGFSNKDVKAEGFWD